MEQEKTVKIPRALRKTIRFIEAFSSVELPTVPFGLHFQILGFKAYLKLHKGHQSL